MSVLFMKQNPIAMQCLFDGNFLETAAAA